MPGTELQKNQKIIHTLQKLSIKLLTDSYVNMRSALSLRAGEGELAH